MPLGCGKWPKQARAARSDSDGDTTAEQNALRAPVWLRIEHRGHRSSAFHSSGNATWTPIIWNPRTVSMPENAYTGLAVMSHDSRRTAEACISHVTTTGAVSPPGPFTESQDIRLQPPPSPQ